MLKKYRGMILSCAILGLTATGSAFAAGPGPQATRIDTTAAYEDIFDGGSSTQAECTADCGDGTGWRCTGTSVTCSDGADGGCVASGGGKTIVATC